MSFHMVHWMNFGQEDVEEGTGRINVVDHEGWMRYSYSDQEPWKKVKFLRDRPRYSACPPVLHVPLLLVLISQV